MKAAKRGEKSILEVKRKGKHRLSGHTYDKETYVSKNRYRKDYRRLANWERQLANYLRRRPTYDGIPAFGKSVASIPESELGMPLADMATVGPIWVCAGLKDWQIRLTLLSGPKFEREVERLIAVALKSCHLT